MKSKNISVDTAAFDTALDEQRNRAKWAGSGASKEEKIWHILKEKLAATNFFGYENDSCDSKIIVIVKDNEEVNELSDGTAFLITSYTPF